MSAEAQYFNSVPFFEKHHYAAIPPHLDLVIIAWQLKTPENIGALIRLSANLGLKKIMLVNDELSNKRASKINKIARSSVSQLCIEQTTPELFIHEMIVDLNTVSLETSTDSTNVFTTNLPDKMALFVGNEITGLPPRVVQQSQLSVHIPLVGAVKSMNVSHAATVAAFEWYRQKMWAK